MHTWESRYERMARNGGAAMTAIIIILAIMLVIGIFYARLYAKAAYLNQYDEVDQNEDKDSRI